MLARLANSIIEFGFRKFRGLIALAGATAVWVCAVWAGWIVRSVYPPTAALLALPFLCVINIAMFRAEERPLSSLAGSRLQELVRLGARIWVACCFTSLFAAAALVTVGVLWTLAHASFDTLVVQAGTTSAVVPPSASDPIDPFFRWVGTACMTVAALALGYGYTAGQRRVGVTRLTLPVRHLPAELDGLRIVQLSDLHIGPYLGADRLSGYVARVNALDPDLIVITGDIVDQRVSDLDPALPALSGLRARYGVVAILGNHDHRAGSDAIAARIELGTEFTLLRDGRFTLCSSDGRLHIIGIEDRGGATKGDAYEQLRLRALRSEIPDQEPVILLAHRPELFKSAAAAGIAITLSGHTHAGQIALHLGRGRTISLGVLMSRFTRGLFEFGGSYLYVNRGLGVVAQPVRVGAPREIAVFELARNATLPTNIRSHDVAAQTFEYGHTRVAIDEHVAPGVLGRTNHLHRSVRPLSGHRCPPAVSLKGSRRPHEQARLQSR
jgi:predicted MPP superfamily phosphohydrolase